jgi:hypothetical protein
MVKISLADWHQVAALKNDAIQACDEKRYEDSARLGSQSLALESAWVCKQAAINRRVL